MSSSINNGTFGLGDDRRSSRHYTSAPRQQHAPPVSNSSSSDLNWIGEPPRESYMPTGLAPATSSWPSTAFPGPPFSASVYGGSVWSGNQRLDGAPFGPYFGGPDGNVVGPETNCLVGFEMAPPLLEQAFPVVQNALPAFQPRPPNWAQAAGLLWQPTLPVRSTAMQNGVHSISSLGMRPELPSFQLAASSLATRHSERRVVPTSRLPPTATPHSVRSLPQSDPVPAAPSTSRPRGERWDISLTTTTFPCLWTSGGTQCTAFIAGDRRSVTSHFRDAHNFSCDSLVIACAWGQCTTPMQRRNLPRHVVACHLEIKVTCEYCGMELSRADANKKHQLACTGGA